MRTLSKVLLSIPYLIYMGYVIVFFNPQKLNWVFPDMQSYNLQMSVLAVLMLTSLGIQLRILWSFKNIARSKKVNWTWLQFFFSGIVGLFFIWKKWEEFELLDKAAQES
ncbi:hypothetical protein [Phaeocystidibacter luteus]|uniref:Uncharacterized protein n=1 Tax=Phaeocystidibacter luteus TaxID=911197 RepID=A0A6N6RJB3_9FLAO|nr:hypothetical protein [Phaeocystidibacter luteus]KAB2807025.1 hypothetical protein F8C67_12575 [Phaeocystidibacter luteus]